MRFTLTLGEELRRQGERSVVRDKQEISKRVPRESHKVVQTFTEMKKRKIVYRDGYEHYGHRRTIQITFFVNEAEKAALDDLMAAMEEKNMSDFIRRQVFRAYDTLTPEQRKKMDEVAKFRAEDARLHELSS